MLAIIPLSLAMSLVLSFFFLFFFFNDTATTEIYTLSLHDALPISVVGVDHQAFGRIDPLRQALERHEAGPVAGAACAIDRHAAIAAAPQRNGPGADEADRTGGVGDR